MYHGVSSTVFFFWTGIVVGQLPWCIYGGVKLGRLINRRPF